MITNNRLLNELNERIHERIRDLGDQEEDQYLRELKAKRNKLIADTIAEYLSGYITGIVTATIQQSLEDYDYVQKKEERQD